MIPLRSKKILAISLILIVIGVVLPWLMVLHLIDSTLFLNFFAYTALVAGMFLGAIGVATYMSDKGDRHR
jgi:hypothetical protein